MFHFVGDNVSTNNSTKRRAACGTGRQMVGYNAHCLALRMKNVLGWPDDKERSNLLVELCCMLIYNGLWKANFIMGKLHTKHG